MAQKKPVGKHGAPVDKRYKELKAQLDDQGKQLKDTQDEVAKNRTDLETSLSSTKDELNGSIAKTHEDLVTLQKRGERNYFEFDLTKSKQFQRFGQGTLLRAQHPQHVAGGKAGRGRGQDLAVKVLGGCQVAPPVAAKGFFIQGL